MKGLTFRTYVMKSNYLTALVCLFIIVTFSQCSEDTFNSAKNHVSEQKNYQFNNLEDVEFSNLNELDDEVQTLLIQYNQIDIEDLYVVHSLYDEEEELKAIDMYYLDTLSVKHKLLLVENGDCSEVNGYTLDTRTYIFNNFLNLVLKELFISENINIHSIHQFINTNVDVEHLAVVEEATGHTPDELYVKLIAKGFENNNWVESSMVMNCFGPFDCAFMENASCVSPNPTTDPECRTCYCSPSGPGPCPAMDNEPLFPSFEFSLYREFRDDFLLNSNLGKKYINYFYALGDHLVDVSLPIGVVADITSTLPVLHQKINLLLNNGNGYSVLINREESLMLEGLFLSLKTLSPNEDYHMILEDIISDIKIIEGMTKNEFLNALE